MVRLKSQVDVKDAKKAAQQQARSDQEYAGKRHFRDHKCGAHAVMLAAFGGSVSGVFQGVLNVFASICNAGANPKRTALALAADKQDKTHCGPQHVHAAWRSCATSSRLRIVGKERVFFG